MVIGRKSATCIVRRLASRTLEEFIPIRLTQVAGFVLGYGPASVKFPLGSVGVLASFPLKYTENFED